MIDEEKIVEFAQELVAAEDERKPIDPITERAELSIEDAYKIQLEIIKMKTGRGEKVIGKKIGLTSKRIQQAFGVHQPDYGHILDKLIAREGLPIAISEFIQPRIEAEIAFVLANRLIGPGVTAAEVLRCTSGVLPVFEIIDSRIKDWKIKIQDTIADNASIGRVILGSPLSNIYGTDLRSLGVVVRKNGEVIETAAGAVVLGNPIDSVAWLANKLSEHGVHLNAGEIVLSGSLIAPIEIGDRDVIQAEYGGAFGSITTYVRK
jgi:2-keto-4-pentenoate hydratase